MADGTARIDDACDQGEAISIATSRAESRTWIIQLSPLTMIIRATKTP
jgi:hypothetical protein